MIHARHHEQALKLPDAIEPTIRGDYSLEIIDGTARKNELIGPPMKRDDLPAMASERGKIRVVVRAEDVVKFLSRLLESLREACDIQRVPVEAGVLHDPKPPKVQRDRKGIGIRQARERGARFKPIPPEPPAGIPRAPPNLYDGISLGI